MDTGFIHELEIFIFIFFIIHRQIYFQVRIYAME